MTLSISSQIAVPRYLFNRDWSVLLTPMVDTGKKDQFGTPIYSASSEGQLYTGLKVVFDIPKTSEGQSNKGFVEVWNLNPTSRRAFQKGSQITLRAGYAGLVNTIYIGDILASGVEIKREGPDIITKFECGSFERQIEDALVVKSYPKGTRALTVFQDCAAAMRVGIAVATGIDTTQTYNHSVTKCQSAKTLLTMLCAKFGLEWSVQDDELQIKPKNQSTGGTAIVLSTGLNEHSQVVENTGLIGVPSRAQGGIVKFSALLNPQLNPGQLVQLISENINGFFQIRNARFQGDSHGDKWQVDCEAYEAPGVQTLANIASQFVSSTGLVA